MRMDTLAVLQLGFLRLGLRSGGRAFAPNPIPEASGAPASWEWASLTACSPACSLFGPWLIIQVFGAVTSEALKIKAGLSEPGCKCRRDPPQVWGGRSGVAAPCTAGQVPPGKCLSGEQVTSLSTKAPGRDDKSTAAWCPGRREAAPRHPDPRLAQGSALAS